MEQIRSSYTESREDLLRRLRKIEGQVKGIQRMVSEEQYCVDVLVQIAAVKAALNKVGTILFERDIQEAVSLLRLNKEMKMR